MEITPPSAQNKDRFLIVYNPKLSNDRENLSIKRLETQSQIGCRIEGSTLAHEFLFAENEHDLTIKLSNGLKQKTINLSVP
nr:hypothetical protein [Methylomarinum sp. Ch1-1]MDP4521188.1 hypothetical protein [Methylomarinum sp. Ch1-1]